MVLGQFVEIPNGIVFTTEYSVLGAIHAVKSSSCRRWWCRQCTSGSTTRSRAFQLRVLWSASLAFSQQVIEQDCSSPGRRGGGLSNSEKRVVCFMGA